MNGSDAPINGSLFRMQREALGWTLADTAVRSCLSLKQVRQLEEGGSESFYSEAVKLTAAKKVASLLGLPAEQALIQPTKTLASRVVAASQPVTALSGLESKTDASQPPGPLAMAVEPVETPPSMAASSDELPSPTPDAQSARTSLWVLAALFAAALLLAAWMNPRPELSTTYAQAPPLQTLPSETADPASSQASVASEAVNAASN